MRDGETFQLEPGPAGPAAPTGPEIPLQERLAAPSPPRPARRSDWVDHARGIGILLVVWGHVVRGLIESGTFPETPGLALADRVIYSFHMPLFFFLSGLFFLKSVQKRGTGGLILSKVEVLVYPYLLWTLIQGGLRVVLSGQTNSGALGWGNVLAIWRPLDQFWFLFGLFFVFVIAALPFRPGVPVRWSIGLLVAAVVLLYTTNLNVPWIWQDVYFLPFLVYFVLAVVLSAGLDRRGGGPQGPASSAAAGGVMIAIGLALVGVLGLVHRGALFDAINATGIDVKTAGLGVAGTAVVCGLARITAAGKLPWIGYLGGVSMLIYVTHTLAASSFRMLLQKGGGVTDPWIHLAAGLAVSLAVPIFLDRWAPKPLVSTLLKPPRRLLRSAR